MCRSSLLFLLLLLSSFTVQAEEQSDTVSSEKFSTWLWDYLTVGASLSAGIGGRLVTIDVTRRDTNDHGRLIENKEDALFLLYSTRARYFSDSNVGYSWLLNLSSIRLNEQELSAKKTVDLGTEVNGYFATTVPVVFYNFGDRDRGQYLRLGVGLGVGVARFNGDVVLTESSQLNDRVTISNGTSNLFLALGFFVDYQWENFAIRLSTAGPNVNINGYEVNVFGTSLMFGYTHYLN